MRRPTVERHPNTTGPSRDPLALTVFLTVVLIGGSNFVAVRFSNQELAPFWGAGIRFAAAALLLFALAAVRRMALPRGTALLATLLFGTLNFGASYAFLYWGLVEAPAALASVLVALAPLLTLLLARAHGLEALSWRRSIAALIAAGGVAVVFGDQISIAVPLVSVLAVLAGTFCIAESTVLAKRLPRLHPFAINAVAMVPGALLLIVLSTAAGEVRSLPVREATWIALAYLVTAGSVGLFVGFLVVIRRWTASATSYATVLFPLVTVAIGALLAGEFVSVTFLAGTVLVMAGVYVGAIAPVRSSVAPG